MNKLLNYFNLNRPRTGVVAFTTEQPKPIRQIPLIEQLFLYLGTVIGVILSPVLVNYIAGKGFDFQLSNFSIITIIISFIIALLIIPFAYKTLSIDPNAPFIVRFGIFFQSGVFWHNVIGAITKAISS